MSYPKWQEQLTNANGKLCANGLNYAIFSVYRVHDFIYYVAYNSF